MKVLAYTLSPAVARGLGVLCAIVFVAGAHTAQAGCDPAYDPSITSPGAAISGWPQRPATTDEINAYVTGIAAQTDRVVTRQFATVVLEIANPEGLAADEHPFARLLLPALAEAGIEAAVRGAMGRAGRVLTVLCCGRTYARCKLSRPLTEEIDTNKRPSPVADW